MQREEVDILVGKVVAPFGVRGEVKVLVLTDFPERFEAGREISLRISDQDRKRVPIESSRRHKDGLVLKLHGIDTMDAAEELRGVGIVVGHDELTELGQDEFYAFDILGMSVSTDDGRDLGEVIEVLQGGANDVYVTSAGVCIPALKDVVSSVDVEHRAMIVRPVPGLIPEARQEKT